MITNNFNVSVTIKIINYIPIVVPIIFVIILPIAIVLLLKFRRKICGNKKIVAIFIRIKSFFRSNKKINKAYKEKT